MTFETWLAFALASSLMLVIPGPTVLLIVSYALGQGWRAAIPMALGTTLGDFTAMTLSLIGVGALLATSATVFTALKIAGAVYLIWLGVKLWRSDGAPTVGTSSEKPAAIRMFLHAWLVTALNPKGITFFIAFVPQFIDTTAPLIPQLAIFEATFLTLAFCNSFGYALIAARAHTLAGRTGFVRLFNKAGGALLVGAGFFTLGVRAIRH